MRGGGREWGMEGGRNGEKVEDGGRDGGVIGVGGKDGVGEVKGRIGRDESWGRGM